MKLDPSLLEGLVAHKTKPGKILSLFQEVGLDAARLSSVNAVADPVTPYSRVVLSAAPECEIMLARWSPDRTCAPHDHGQSAGWVFYIEQDFEEQSYHWHDGELVADKLFSHRAGTYTEVVRNEIHSCATHGRGLSLHVYFPRIEKMRVYDLAARRTIVVSDDCGAWVPERAEQRIEEKAWPR